MWRNKDDNEPPIDDEGAIISQLIIETPRKNVNKDGICLLGSRPIESKQRIIICKHRDETKVSKILRKFKGDDVFLGCVVLSRFKLVKLTIVHKVHSMIGQSGSVCLSIYLFTGIPVTIYSTTDLSDSVIVLGLTPQNLRKNPGGAVDWNQSSPSCPFWPRNGKTKKRKNDQIGTQAIAILWYHKSVLLHCAQHPYTAAWTHNFVVVERCMTASRLMLYRLINKQIAKSATSQHVRASAPFWKLNLSFTAWQCDKYQNLLSLHKYC